jgi:peptidoglycan hydrolase-like protein with peptidoglycan-binding domain
MKLGSSTMDLDRVIEHLRECGSKRRGTIHWMLRNPASVQAGGRFGERGMGMCRVGVIVLLLCCVSAHAADFTFFGRAGDAIELDLAALPAVSPGATFSGLNISGLSGHTVLTSDTLTSQPFGSTGRLWVFPNPARNTPALGDTDPASRGFQGTVSGSVLVNGVSKTFSVTVRPGYTGSGAGTVGQSSEQLNDSTNNPLFVAQQQQRLRYLGFVDQGGTALAVDGEFGPRTDQAARTFQGAFVAGINTTQDDVDGIIGPNTAAWLNAANAPKWDELIDPDPQVPGTFSTNTMIGNFDIYPSPDPGTGNRTGLTPQRERWATNWTNDLISKGSALAKATTGRTQRINALSTNDGYGSSCCHNTHRVGMDIDLYTNSSTWNAGDGVRSAEEQIVINHAAAFINAGASGRVIRFITSNDDIYDGIAALSPSAPLFFDTSGAHQNHLHIDVGSPTRQAGLANLPGDFDLNDVVDATDYVMWRKLLGVMYTSAQYQTWRTGFGRVRTSAVGGGGSGSPVPEPSAAALVAMWTAAIWLRRSQRGW